MDGLISVLTEQNKLDKASPTVERKPNPGAELKVSVSAPWAQPQHRYCCRKAAPAPPGEAPGALSLQPGQAVQAREPVSEA